MLGLEHLVGLKVFGNVTFDICGLADERGDVLDDELVPG
jgi:hypothetical protein